MKIQFEFEAINLKSYNLIKDFCSKNEIDVTNKPNLEEQQASIKRSFFHVVLKGKIDKLINLLNYLQNNNFKYSILGKESVDAFDTSLKSDKLSKNVHYFGELEPCGFWEKLKKKTKEILGVDVSNKQEYGVPHYCEDFDKELNYKLWSTYCARFNASKRLGKKSYLSSLAINFCSSYVILFSVFGFMFANQLFSGHVDIVNSVITFSTIALSIFIIVFSLIESNSHHELRAEKYHACGLAISNLYKRLRYIKSTYKDKKEGNDFMGKVSEIANEYDQILEKYENHEEIDFRWFELQKPDYITHKKTWYQKFKIRIWYHSKFFVYWAVMIFPLFLFGVIFYIFK